MMEPASAIPKFEHMKREPTEHEKTNEAFNPSSHDIIYLDSDGKPRIGRNASPHQMINVLKASNERFLCAPQDSSEPFASSLIVIRFEEQEPIDEGAVTDPTDDWNTLWPYFDSCCNPNADALDFVSSIRQREPHCNSCILPNTSVCGLSCPKCHRISYNLDFGSKHILIIHHFHDVDGQSIEMIRMMTYGLQEEKIALVLDKAISSIQDTSNSAQQIPHPKIILCCMLECVETWCRMTLRSDKKYVIEKLENQIRNSDLDTPNGLQIRYIELNDARIYLTEVKRKLEYTKLAVDTIVKINGFPDGMIESEERWNHQLKGVCRRLEALILRCQELTICLESLQERVRGILSIVKILLAEKENEYSRTSDAMRQEREAFQIEMLKHQQDIAIRAKRDNTIMKVIAVLSALFLPGTLIAQIFAIPTFQWGEDQVFGRHFMVYWDFTIPITATLVIGFSAWFIKGYLDDRKKEAVDIRNRIKDAESRVDSRSISEKGSLASRRMRSP